MLVVSLAQDTRNCAKATPYIDSALLTWNLEQLGVLLVLYQVRFGIK